MRFRFEILSGFSRNAKSSALSIKLLSLIVVSEYQPIKPNQGYMLTFEAKIRRIHNMERVEIQQIAAYLKDLEEGLDEWDYHGPATLGDLNRLYVIITHLMKATYEIEDQELKPLLATLEYKARRCKQCIEARLAVRN
ncbi:MAG: hypothetical protein CEE38_17270 [Planctomycetes bacterium B3_Pla]|nr:MAG: hypothetical protein CEE38_17270 [Planctomycetes bacterium B3_Pla]